MIIDFLQPVSDEVVAHAKLQDAQALGNSIQIYGNNTDFPDIQKNTLVIIGVPENRNDINYLGQQPSFNRIRKSLYELFPGSWTNPIVDIGNIIPGETVSDTYFALKQTVTESIKLGAIPIILGGSHDLTYALYRAYDRLDQMVSLVSIDHKFDLKDPTEGIKNNNYLNSIIVEEPNNLINYTNLGFQTYFNSQEEIDLIERLYFESYRIGEVTQSLSMMEPIMRDADIVSFDIGSISASDISTGKGYRSPNGFSGKEACAISRYAGLSNKVSSFGLFELNDYLSDAGEMLVAQILWYFIEGFNTRFKEPPLSEDHNYTKYIVPLKEFDLVFYKSMISQRWWVNIPDNQHEAHNNSKKLSLLSCTHEDYLLACDHQIPERIYKAFRKHLI